MRPANGPLEIEYFKTIASGDLQRLRELTLSHPELLNSYDYGNFGATSLTAACYSNRPNVVETLLDLGADPDRKSDWKMGPWSPLHCAIYRRDKAIVELLLSRGATMDVHTAAGLGDVAQVKRLLDEDPTLVSERGGDGCQALHFADSVSVAEALLDGGADIDARCIDHYSTPVQYLCTCRPEVACYLLARGAAADIFTAVTAGDSAAVERLLNEDPKWIEARINQTTFPPGPEHNVHNILTFTVGQDATPLHAAAKSDQAQIIKLLASRGASPNTRGAYDQGTALHTAAWHNSLQAAEALLDVGADIEIKSGRLHNNTPAGWAIVAGADSVFEMLMDRGAVLHPWFIDDAKDACSGRFGQVTNATIEQRQRILDWLTSHSTAT